MISQYSVVRYVPNAIAGEFINVGVLAWGDGRVHALFSEDWSRVAAFGGYEPGFLVNFAARFQAGEDGRITEEALLKMIDEWSGAIQFSRPLPSRGSPEETLRKVAPHFIPVRANHAPTWLKPYENNPTFLRDHSLLFGRR